MSQSTLLPSPDDFDDLEFAALVADFHTQPLGEPPLEPELNRSFSRRASRGVEERAAIELSLGIRRHRTDEREA